MAHACDANTALGRLQKPDVMAHACDANTVLGRLRQKGHECEGYLGLHMSL